MSVTEIHLIQNSQNLNAIEFDAQDLALIARNFEVRDDAARETRRGRSPFSPPEVYQVAQAAAENGLCYDWEIDWHRILSRRVRHRMHFEMNAAFGL